MTTTVTIQAGGHPVRVTECTQGQSVHSQDIAPHTTATHHIWQGKGMTLVELPVSEAEKAAAALEATAAPAIGSTLEAGDALAASVQQPGRPRVELGKMRHLVAEVEFHRPLHTPHLTIAIIKLVNGFTLVGKSAPADPANFNAGVGETFAADDAMRQLWSLEGYLLRQRLHDQASAAA